MLAYLYTELFTVFVYGSRICIFFVNIFGNRSVAVHTECFMVMGWALGPAMASACDDPSCERWQWLTSSLMSCSECIHQQNNLSNAIIMQTLAYTDMLYAHKWMVWLFPRISKLQKQILDFMEWEWWKRFLIHHGCRNIQSLFPMYFYLSDPLTAVKLKVKNARDTDLVPVIWYANVLFWFSSWEFQLLSVK